MSGPAGHGDRPGSALGARGGLGAAAPEEGGDPAAEYGPYLVRLRERIQGSLSYPLGARRRGLSGTVSLEIEITPEGAIGAVSVAGTSSHPILDSAALEAVRRLAPEPLPNGVPPRALRVRLPVVFALERP